MIRFVSAAVVSAVAIFSVWPAAAQQKRPSPQEVISSSVDGNRITVIYGRPFSKDPKDAKGEQIRKIWGTLVPYGKVWRTGANEATVFISQKPVIVGGKEIPGGVAYSLYTLPMENGTMKLIFNKELGQTGDQYDEKNDLARVDMKKETLDKRLDQFTIAIDNTPAGGAVLKMMWENAQFSVPIMVKK